MFERAHQAPSQVISSGGAASSPHGSWLRSYLHYQKCFISFPSSLHAVAWRKLSAPPHRGSSSYGCHESSPQPLRIAKSSSCFPTAMQQNTLGACYPGRYFLVGWGCHSPASALCKGRDLTNLLFSKPKVGWAEEHASSLQAQGTNSCISRLSCRKEDGQRVVRGWHLENSGKILKK